MSWVFWAKFDCFKANAAPWDMCGVVWRCVLLGAGWEPPGGHDGMCDVASSNNAVMSSDVAVISSVVWELIT